MGGGDAEVEGRRDLGVGGAGQSSWMLTYRDEMRGKAGAER